MFQRKKLRIFWGLTSMSFLFIGLSGCKDFSDVRDLGKRSEIIKVTSEQIGNDLYDSCKRRAKLSPSRFPGNIGTENNPFAEGTRRGEQKKCQEKFLPASQKIIEVNSVLVTYLQKLAILADEDTGAIKEEDKTELTNAVNNLLSALGNTGLSIPPLVSSNVGQGINILGVVFDIIGDQIREDAIVPAMICTDDEIQKYTEGLEEIANTFYINALENEKDEIGKYYTLLTPRGSDELISLPSEQESLDNLRRRYDDQLDLVDAKQEQHLAFATVLKETRQTHSEISKVFEEDFDYGKAKTKEQFCKNYESQIKTTDASFELNPVQAQKISTILKQYQKNTESLFKKLEQTKSN
jgi:hypothetical protein